ncbi:MAG: tetratricopeptide repeat protein, partial [Anaerolineales bacterium]|nr:tetratricopeptide repeat protein [Anaerolineales bacterium]
MATIPLRAYNREIENLIDTGRVDEAIAHCRHILQAFPKHVATYRLFGKAHLESQRFGDASDIFARVLSAIPDDFVANVGMSIVREDEGNLDAAIWHMERAFETQPANSAIQEELRRLYGRRDGVEPLKVRLTRGALARMYAKSDLYDQAIAELRAALSEDSQRPDLQVLLAQMYYAAGQKVDAVATSTALIQKFPYCLEANRVLTAILPETERAADTQIYQQRIIAMDPYTARSDTASLTTENVPDDAVTIEKLVLKPGQSTIGAEQPAWAASLENAFEDTSSKLPEWLTESPETPALVSGAKAFPSRVSPISTEEQPEGEEITTTGAPAEAPEPSAEIPEWMQEAGWKPATGEAQEGPISFDEGTDFELPEGEIAPGQIPDWLKDMAPSGTLEEEIPSTSEELEKASLPWLEEKEPGTTDTVISWLDREQPKEEPHVESPTSEELATEEGSLPDWLAEMKPPAVAAPPESAEITEAIPEEGLPEAPPWLAGEETVTPESKTTPAKEQQPPSGDTEALPDWLRSPAEPETERTGITDWLREVQEESPAPSDEMPVWLKEMEQEIPGEQETPPPTDWFAEQTEAKPRIVPEELDAAPTSAEELPDWLSEMAEPAQREEEAPAELAAGLPEWPAEEPAAVEAA